MADQKGNGSLNNPGAIEIGPTFVGARPTVGIRVPILNGPIGGGVHPPFFAPTRELAVLSATVAKQAAQFSANHKEAKATDKQRLDDLVNARSGDPAGASALATVTRRLTAVRKTLAQQQAKHAQQTEIALRFSGESPIGLSGPKLLQLLLSKGTRQVAAQQVAWQTSYKAALSAQRLQDATNYLTRQAEKLQARQIVEQERARVYAERKEAVKVAHADAAAQSKAHSRAAAQLTNSLAKVSHFVEAANQPTPAVDTSAAVAKRIAALEKTQRSLTQLKADLRAKLLASAQTHKQLKRSAAVLAKRLEKFATPALMEKVQSAARFSSAAGEQVLQAQQTFDSTRQQLHQLNKAIDRSATVTQRKINFLSDVATPAIESRVSTFSAPAASLVAPTFMTAVAGSAALFDQALPALRKALANAVKALAGSAVGAAQGAGAFVTLITYSAQLGNGDLHAVAVPLGEIDSDAEALLDAAARRKTAVRVKARMGWTATPAGTQLLLAAADDAVVPANVRVRQAKWNAKKGAYTFTTDSTSPVTLLWTPLVTPESSSTTSPPTAIEEVSYKGKVIVPKRTEVSPLPAIDDVHFSDYIIEFPLDSGLERIYIMLKDRRDIPGVASGRGEAVSGQWLNPSAKPEGSPIPAHIAALLTGKRYANFKAFRKAFWKAVAADRGLATQFNKDNNKRMAEGLAPRAQHSEHVGKRKSFEIHHVHEIGKGGAVYDIENMRLLSPRQHIRKHSRRNHND